MVTVYKGLFIEETKSRAIVKTDGTAITAAVSVLLVRQQDLYQSIGSLIGCQVVEVGMVLGQHRGCEIIQIDVNICTRGDGHM